MKHWLPRLSRRWLIATTVVYVLTAAVLYLHLGYAPRFQVDAPDQPPNYPFVPLQIVGFSPDGRLFATHVYSPKEEDKQVGVRIRIWDVATGQLKRQWQPRWPNVRGAAFSPDSLYYVVQGMNFCVRVWDVENGRAVFALKDAPVGDCFWSHFSFSPDGRTLIIPAPGTLRFIDTETWRERVSVKTDNREEKVEELVHGFAATFNTDKVGPGQEGIHRFSPDGRTLLWGEEEGSGFDAGYKLLVIDVLSGRVLYRVSRGREGTFSADGRWFAVWNRWHLWLCETAAGHEMAHAFVDVTDIQKAWFCSRTGRLLTLLDESDNDGGEDHKMHLVAWNFDGTTLREVERRTFFRGWVSPDKKSLATLTKIKGADPATCRLQVHRLDTGKMVEVGTVPYSYGQLAFSPCGRYLTVDFDRDERETATKPWFRECIEWLTGKRQSADEICREHIAGTLDLRVWDLQTGKETALPAYHSMGFSPDGKTLVTLNPDYAVHFWDVPPRHPWLAILGGAAFPASLVGTCGWWRTRRRIRQTAPQPAAPEQV